MDAQAVLRPAPPRRAPRVPARLLRLAADERLVELVRAGSEPAFEAVFDRHHRGILAFCRHMLGSAEEAEDAVQHVFLAAYRALRADDDRAVHLRPWLYAIARNRCLSVLRARRERPLDEVAEPSTEHLADAVQRREDLRSMLRDVAGLPDDQRAALVLAELGDVSHEEIAEVLGVRREKVKALVFQARSSLAASRVAREISCVEVREQLAELRGGSLRRTSLRRHLRDCPGCREFRRAMTSQRRALAVLLPVVPTAGLKGAVLGSAFGGGSAAAAGGAAGGAGAGGGAAGGSAVAGASGAALTSAASSVGGAGLAKALVVVAIAGSSAAVGERALTAHPVPAPGVDHAAPAIPAHAVRHGAPAVVRAAAPDAVGARPAEAASAGASAIAHENGHRARGRHSANADGNHGLGGGTGGGRSQAPGQVAKPNGAHPGPGSPTSHGTATAPGRPEAPGASPGSSGASGQPRAGGPAGTTGSAGSGRPATSNSGGQSALHRTTTTPAASAPTAAVTAPVERAAAKTAPATPATPATARGGVPTTG